MCDWEYGALPLSTETAAPKVLNPIDCQIVLSWIGLLGVAT
jgi:hypothetical protein